MQEMSRSESVRAFIAKDGMYAENAGAIFCAKYANFQEAAGHTKGMPFLLLLSFGIKESNSHAYP